ncbi:MULTISPECIES: phosphate ABC transporter permease subunit PstC [unclassified Devosia]|uniref:phosphate ABC transporter permease subunit PstC n=1 Tax=unclassified Devosia TaxID=196773 RepID=UPI00086A84C6|nr:MULTISPECIES: phosphate ABC transporter permease subunit PstC [unclassified Devosia]MBN9360973.1 phosphate ABC transporter permease subunit PstC [Devosia sp.]ODS82667.1 MAG: phosphate ABC transporter permease subunit PstC [Devosia sp. SCN 66-27]OJX22914.1 MAG: phosphate ABC transporter permease subunit PstC [Devosia sp. 66-14]
MSAGWVVAIVLAIGAIAYFFSAQRARVQRDASDRSKEVPHSLPTYHGWLSFIFATVPALLVFLALSAVSSAILESRVRTEVSAHLSDTSAASLSIGIVHNVSSALNRLDLSGANVPTSYAALRDMAKSSGIVLADSGEDYMLPLAASVNADAAVHKLIGQGLTLLLSLAGAAFAYSRIRLRLRARNEVERVVLWSLLAASTVAILTTVGIVLSMLSETVHFFSEVNPLNFFFGTVWDPRFAAAGSGGTEGQFGLIPLLAGTLYIAFVSMLFAVPVGLMAAVYMGEYASSKVRSTVKPLLELLAGIPTIVYGIFAVVTLGPFFRDLSAALAGGFAFIQAQSVLTAGIVMGVMLIPVVSSLSDDVITAVPRAMRDGSLALGATRSETIRKVILPAALPGIVGALLLTASRAIGETMIVVLAAGVAARINFNPFEAMTTITVKIVNQLTGDLEFNSPQTLVAFALGLTLFALTLAMNVYALYIVRKYREQYE